jgi:hypothetical protein
VVRFLGICGPLAAVALSCSVMVRAQVTKADEERAAGLVAKFQELTENVADVPSWVEDHRPPYGG